MTHRADESISPELQRLVDRQTISVPTCQCSYCKCDTMLTEAAWDKPRRERLCEDCEAGDHNEELR